MIIEPLPLDPQAIATLDILCSEHALDLIHRIIIIFLLLNTANNYSGKRDSKLSHFRVLRVRMDLEVGCRLTFPDELPMGDTGDRAICGNVDL